MGNGVHGSLKQEQDRQAHFIVRACQRVCIIKLLFILIISNKSIKGWLASQLTY